MPETLQPASLDIWDKKYRLKDRHGNPIDQTVEDTYRRVAKALASVEKNPAEWEEKFMWALENGAIPAGRIVSNAGAEEHKPATSLINCTVSGTIEDSMHGILGKVYEGGMTLKAGCGIGYEFSTLRPKGAFVNGAGARTSGALSFMDIYDSMCFTVASAGGRRGAQMATLDVSHPDVMEFITAKREDGRLRQFNLSLLITDRFIRAVLDDEEWPLVFPLIGEKEAAEVNLSDPEQVVWREWPITDGYITNEEGLVACKVYKKIPARRLWDMIMTSTYDFAEPGFILIDKVNEMNNNWFCENIRATNPCGEQPLPPYGACLLGSVNLTKFVEHPFTDKASFNWDKYTEVVKIFTRMLDNVVELNQLPLAQQEAEIRRKRRHGMGFLGLGSALAMLKVKYGSEDSIQFTERVAYTLAITGWEVGVELAKEKGPAPIMDEDFTDPSGLDNTPVKGRVLFANSKYMQQIKREREDLWEDILEHGCRFTHHSSIAPTGTISLSLANNASNGIEPSFAHHYSRNVIREGKKTKEKVDVYSYEFLKYREIVGKDVGTEDLPSYFMDTNNITPLEHVKIQAAAQKWVDSSISKTINIPTDYPYEDFKDVYLQAWEHGLKGCTTFRFNPEAFQGVLVKEDDLESTAYRFTLEDGSTVDLKGNDVVEYDGEEHTAANLFDALKEGYYGKL